MLTAVLARRAMDCLKLAMADGLRQSRNNWRSYISFMYLSCLSIGSFSASVSLALASGNFDEDDEEEAAAAAALPLLAVALAVALLPVAPAPPVPKR